MNYFQKRKTPKVFHGIMFHHFIGGKYSFNSQGAIDIDRFRDILKFIGIKNILNPQEFIDKYEKNILKDSDVCLTFDDSLLSQYEIAYPLLDDLGIKAFFFIYTSIFDKGFNFFETVRYFAASKFIDFYEFCDNFFTAFSEFKGIEYQIFLKKHKVYMNETLLKHPYYTKKDVEFRTLRDLVLTQEEYRKIILLMFNKYNFDPIAVHEKIFLSKNHLIKLANQGNLIGLHTHNHPFLLESLPPNKQLLEYETNKNMLESIIGKKIICMSHPNGSYDSSTLNLLSDFDLRIGFKASMVLDRGMNNYNQSRFEIMREDHTNINLMLK